ncbi:MAG: chromosome segregation protein SMC [Oscillospiraceae bacterium]|nr:chromosome segregation protein SMC [Oscillospiraceae bacterium]
MYLKALEIQGFKSFPDKTVLNFGEDLTAIVGPNGSGKSNISDAIRWVMGEQSAKGLRGAKMEDVIFGGTQKRRQVGFAQVTLVLDNTGHIFPGMEESEVAVTRRYYRSGESEYYINRQSVRLRDVMELFMDTGLGREGYSIIGQGKIDEILSAKSGERREIFEEAAGISRYRHRKEETERKLERTQENLTRVNDKISELELQVEPLRVQADKAKRFLILRDELRVLELSLWLEQLDALKVTAEKVRVDYAAASQERDEAREALDTLYAEGERFGEAMRDKDIESEALRAQNAELEAQRHERESAVAVLETGIAHQRENIQRAREELDETEYRSGGLVKQAAELEAQSAELSDALTARNTVLNALLEQAREASERADDVRLKMEAFRAREADALAAAAELRTEAAAVNAENGQIQARRDAASIEYDEAKRRLEITEQQSTENASELETAREELKAAGNRIAGYQLRAGERQKKAAGASELRMQMTMDVGALDNRIRLLTDMEREYEGFSRAVKAVMRAGGRLTGIHGPVAELMSTDAAYTVAIEIALGAALQNIVVDREEDAKRAIEFLKHQDAGRATFLPLTAIRGDELRDTAPSREPGFVGIASRLVKFDTRYQGIFYNLLGRTVVVENLDYGIAMARKFRNAFRIVTLDGQVINKGGSMTGGSVSRNAGVLSRKAELDRLNERAGTLKRNLEAAKQKEEQANRELSAARYDLEAAEAERRQTQELLLRLEEARKHFDESLPGFRRNAENLQAELSELKRRFDENGARLDELKRRIGERDAEATQCHGQAAEAFAGQSELLAASGTLSEQITAERETCAALSAERDAAANRAADLRKLSDELSGGAEQKEAALKSYAEAIRKAEADIEARQREIEAFKQRETEIGDALKTLNKDRLELEAQRTAQNRKSQEMNENLLRMERLVSKLEQKLSAAALEEKQIVDKMWENYEISRTDAAAQRIELESVPKATRRAGELKREIHGLGAINMGAIEEFERVNTRYTYLTGQRDDIDKARVELEGIITEITNQMTVIFGHQFKLLSESFQTTFVELFGGGAARLELEDPSDILNCGIEIKAQPPGKTLKTISLLSGGEKAFVAIALYFSILKVHPTPFCVMDEIEAALDDVNVTRYARYMRNLTAKTQFIVITHRRGTMEEADVLYGVTMQEQGISKILTINLNDMAKQLKLN